MRQKPDSDAARNSEPTSGRRLKSACPPGAALAAAQAEHDDRAERNGADEQQRRVVHAEVGQRNQEPGEAGQLRAEIVEDLLEGRNQKDEDGAAEQHRDQNQNERIHQVRRDAPPQFGGPAKLFDGVLNQERQSAGVGAVFEQQGHAFGQRRPQSAERLVQRTALFQRGHHAGDGPAQSRPRRFLGERPQAGHQRQAVPRHRL